MVDHADGHFVGDEAGNGAGRGVAGNGDHVQAHGADAGHGFQLFQAQQAGGGGRLDAGVFRNRDEGAGQAAHGRGGEGAALFHGIVEHGQHGRGAGRTDAGQAHALEDLAHAVAHGRGGGQGKVGHAEGQAQTLGHFVTDHLAHAGHLVGRTLDDFGHIQQGHGLAAVTAVLQGAVDGLLDHAGAGDAHVDDHVGLAHAQVGTGHEGHVLRDVGEDHQLGAAKAAAVGRGLGHLEDLFAHQGHGIHIDAGAGRGHVDGGADAVRGGQGFGQGLDEGAVTVGETFFHQGGETAQEVDAGFLGRFVQGLTDAHHAVGAEGGPHHGDGADADTFIDHRDAVLVAHFVADVDQLGGIAVQLGFDVAGEEVDVMADTVEQAHAQGHGAHVQMLVAEHVERIDNFAFRKHGYSL